jgi:hypothetical protein
VVVVPDLSARAATVVAGAFPASEPRDRKHAMNAVEAASVGGLFLFRCMVKSMKRIIAKIFEVELVQIK